jgi:hypothetical protein
MIRDCYKPVLLCAALLGAPVVKAEDWYVGLGFGSSTYEFADDLEDMGGLADEMDDYPGIDASFDSEDGDTAVKIFAGMPLNHIFTFEFGYVDLGETTADFSLDSDGSLLPAGSTRVSSVISIDGFNAGLIASLPLSDSASINGRAGVYLWNAEGQFESEDSTGFFENISESVSDDGNDAYYGAGLNAGWFDFFYEIYDIDGEDVDFLGISAKYQLN